MHVGNEIGNIVAVFRLCFHDAFLFDVKKKHDKQELKKKSVNNENKKKMNKNLKKSGIIREHYGNE